MERRNLNQGLGRRVSPKSIVLEMLMSKESWFTVLSAIVKMKNKLVKEVRMKVEWMRSTNA